MKGKVILIVALVVLAVGVGAYVVFQYSGGTGSAQRELVVVSYGGSYQDAQRKAFFEPFEQAFNVKIIEESHTGDLAKIKVMVESGNVTWDVVDVEGPLLLRGASDNLYEPLDLDQMPTDELMPQAVNDHGIAVCFWSTVMAYNTAVYGADDHPTSWAEFWDSERFPGSRSLRDYPISTLEFALLVDGVAPVDLYPLDVDRAFASLDKIKDQVGVWWETGEQPPQLLSSGEVVLSSAYNGRIYNARQADKPVMELWAGGLVDADWWVIPRGSKHTDLAMQFIAFASQAQQQALLPKFIPYGPINILANEQLPPELAADLPTYPANLQQQAFINTEWWDQNLDAVLERWQTWLLQ